jgi:hypothetical protein
VGVFGNSAIIDRLDDWEFLDGLWIHRPGAGQLMELSYGRPAARLDRLDKCPASPAQPSGVFGVRSNTFWAFGVTQGFRNSELAPLRQERVPRPLRSRRQEGEGPGPEAEPPLASWRPSREPKIVTPTPCFDPSHLPACVWGLSVLDHILAR